jgi:hypothetical protein
MRVALDVVLVVELMVKEVRISESVVISLCVLGLSALNWFLLGGSVARSMKFHAGINSGVRAPPVVWRLLG